MFVVLLARTYARPSSPVGPSIIKRLGGFVKLKKIREKLGSGWVGQAPTRCFFYIFLVFCVCCFYVFKKKMGRGVGSFGLTNPSFLGSFGFILT